MRIIDGKWVNDQGDPLSIFEAKEIKELGERVISLFGKNNITYNRINIVNSITKLSEEKEELVNSVLSE
jgi:hypothetical protein